VPLDLAHDRRHGVRGELHLPRGVEALDREQQADRADLEEIVEWLATPASARRQAADERHVAVDERVARASSPAR
jgi:hypothetical protein